MTKAGVFNNHLYENEIVGSLCDSEHFIVFLRKGACDPRPKYY